MKDLNSSNSSSIIVGRRLCLVLFLWTLLFQKQLFGNGWVLTKDVHLVRGGSQETDNKNEEEEKKNEVDTYVQRVSEQDGLLKKKFNAVGDPSDDSSSSDSESDSDVSDDILLQELTSTTKGGKEGEEPNNVQVQVVEYNTRGGATTKHHHPRMDNDDTTQTNNEEQLIPHPETEEEMLDRLILEAFEKFIQKSPKSTDDTPNNDNNDNSSNDDYRSEQEQELYELLLSELSGIGQRRRFLSKEYCQKLVARLCLACQPQWRRHYQTTFSKCGLRLYSTSDEQEIYDSPSTTTSTTSSASLQQLVAQALAHSQHCSFLSITDDILTHIQNSLLPKKQLSFSQILSKLFALQTKLVLFLPVDSCREIIASKSTLECLAKECTSSESTHFLILGKSQKDFNSDTNNNNNNNNNNKVQSSEMDFLEESPTMLPPPYGHPQHQQVPFPTYNDPEGSQRLNIVLARTIDPVTQQVGIVGAVASPTMGQQVLAPLLQSNPSHANVTLPPPPVWQATISHAVQDLLEKMGQEHSILKDNAMLKQGIADNLARAAPALSDPRCQGVMLSVYIPPNAANQHNQKSNKHNSRSANNYAGMGGWLSKILNNSSTSNVTNTEVLEDEEINNSNEEGEEEEEDETTKSSISKRDRKRNLAVANALMAFQNRFEKHTTRLQSLCLSAPLKRPQDPIRARLWDAWISRHQSTRYLKNNAMLLQNQLETSSLKLSLQDPTQLESMLSAKEFSPTEIEEIVNTGIELEAILSQQETETNESTSDLDAERNTDIDPTWKVILEGKDGVINDYWTSVDMDDCMYLRTESIEKAITLVCGISPSPFASASSMSCLSQTVTHRSKEELSSLAVDKHEKALLSQVVLPQDIGISYDQIGGLEDVKELLRQSITYPLKFPHLYSEGIAREAVKGVLLFGPPGTGKTMLAKAVATEGGATFLSVDASSVENKWLGESEKNAKAVFTLARRLAPCVIFIDEVDSILSSREGTSDDSAHGTLTSVKTTMMSEWDGLNSSTESSQQQRVIVIGSTNRPFDLDEAVLRRFPRRILVDLPDATTREEILQVTLSENRLDPAVNLTEIALKLDGYTGSDLKEICREAVVQISHEQAQSMENSPDQFQSRLRPVTMKDLELAVQKLKKSVSEKGRELARVWEWNDEYGELKTKHDKRNSMPQLMNMFL